LLPLALSWGQDYSSGWSL